MRYLSLTFLLMAIVTFTACQTGSADLAKDSILSPDSLEKKERQNFTVDGDWLILFHCDGMDYLLHTQSWTTPNSFQLSLSGNPEQMEMALQGSVQSRLQPVPQELHGEYDDKINAFSVSDRLGAQQTVMRGVFESSDRFAAKIEGRNWRNCSLVIGVRKKHRDELEKLRAKADSKLPDLFKKSQIGHIFRQFASRPRNRDCNKDEIQWISNVQPLDNHFQGRGSNRSIPATAMFKDDNFEPFFDKPLREMSLKQGMEIATVLQMTSGCGKIRTDRVNQQVLNDVAKILQNSPPLTRNYAMITNAASDIIHNWLKANTFRLVRMEKNYLETPETGLERINTLEKTAKLMNALVWGAENPEYLNQLAASRASLEKKSFFKVFARQYEATTNTFNGLNQLAGFPSNNAHRYQLLSEVEKEQLQNQIQKKVNESAMEAANAYIKKSQSEESYAELGRWRTQFSFFSSLLIPANQVSIDQFINRHREKTASYLLAKFKEQSNQSYPTALEALSANVAFEKRMQKARPELINLPEFRRFSEDRASLRRAQLSQAVMQVEKKISICANETELANVRKTYLLHDDEQTAAGKIILYALQTRLKTVAPFSGYPGAVYLNALYGSDWETIAEEDRKFAKPLIRMMQPMLNSGIYDLMALAGGGNGQDLKQYMNKKMENATMSTSMAGFFVIGLEHIAPQCLGPNPIQIERTETWDQVFYNGYGMELYRLSNEQTYHYTIARRHRRVFNKIGEPASAESIEFINALLGQFGMKKDGVRVSMEKLGANLRGLKMAMENYPCDGEVMERIETALIKKALEQ